MSSSAQFVPPHAHTPTGKKVQISETGDEQQADRSGRRTTLRRDTASRSLQKEMQAQAQAIAREEQSEDLEAVSAMFAPLNLEEGYFEVAPEESAVSKGGNHHPLPKTSGASLEHHAAPTGPKIELAPTPKDKAAKEGKLTADWEEEMERGMEEPPQAVIAGRNAWRKEFPALRKQWLGLLDAMAAESASGSRSNLAIWASCASLSRKGIPTSIQSLVWWHALGNPARVSLALFHVISARAEEVHKERARKQKEKEERREAKRLEREKAKEKEGHLLTSAQATHVEVVPSSSASAMFKRGGGTKVLVDGEDNTSAGAAEGDGDAPVNKRTHFSRFSIKGKMAKGSNLGRMVGSLARSITGAVHHHHHSATSPSASSFKATDTQQPLETVIDSDASADSDASEDDEIKADKAKMKSLMPAKGTTGSLAAIHKTLKTTGDLRSVSAPRGGRGAGVAAVSTSSSTSMFSKGSMSARPGFSPGGVAGAPSLSSFSASAYMALPAMPAFIRSPLDPEYPEQSQGRILFSGWIYCREQKLPSTRRRKSIAPAPLQWKRRWCVLLPRCLVVYRYDALRQCCLNKRSCNAGDNAPATTEDVSTFLEAPPKTSKRLGCVMLDQGKVEVLSAAPEASGDAAEERKELSDLAARSALLSNSSSSVLIEAPPPQPTVFAIRFSDSNTTDGMIMKLACEDATNGGAAPLSSWLGWFSHTALSLSEEAKAKASKKIVDHGASLLLAHSNNSFVAADTGSSSPSASVFGAPSTHEHQAFFSASTITRKDSSASLGSTATGASSLTVTGPKRSLHARQPSQSAEADAAKPARPLPGTAPIAPSPSASSAAVAPPARSVSAPRSARSSLSSTSQAQPRPLIAPPASSSAAALFLAPPKAEDGHHRSRTEGDADNDDDSSLRLAGGLGRKPSNIGRPQQNATSSSSSDEDCEDENDPGASSSSEGSEGGEDVDEESEDEDSLAKQAAGARRNPFLISKSEAGSRSPKRKTSGKRKASDEEGLVLHGTRLLNNHGHDEDEDDEHDEEEETREERWCREIESDLSRTFPRLAFFAEGSPMRAQLRRVLLSYALYRPDHGYSQGMSHLAAVLMLCVGVMAPAEEEMVAMNTAMEKPSSVLPAGGSSSATSRVERTSSDPAEADTAAAATAARRGSRSASPAAGASATTSSSADMPAGSAVDSSDEKLLYVPPSMRRASTVTVLSSGSASEGFHSVGGAGSMPSPAATANSTTGTMHPSSSFFMGSGTTARGAASPPPPAPPLPPSHPSATAGSVLVPFGRKQSIQPSFSAVVSAAIGNGSAGDESSILARVKPSPAFHSEMLVFRSLTSLVCKLSPLRALLERDTARLHVFYSAFTRTLQRASPMTASTLDNQGIEPSIFLVPWLLSLFTRALGLEVAVRLWDRILLGNGSNITGPPSSSSSAGSQQATTSILVGPSAELLRCCVGLTIHMQPTIATSTFEESMRSLACIPGKLRDEFSIAPLIDGVSIGHEDLLALAAMDRD
jgi:Rab-GTPase-TBC domain